MDMKALNAKLKKAKEMFLVNDTFGQVCPLAISVTVAFQF
jgi:hypothetical protein